MAHEQEHAVIFGSLHADVFRLFSGRTRWFYEGLLDYLNEAVFSDGIMVPRSAVLDAIENHILNATYSPDEEEGDGEPRDERNKPRDIIYNRLLKTGWLVEHRDRYRKLVDMDSNARLLLEALLDIKSGRLRSYGGEVLQVLTQLEAARRDPENRSEAIANAARSAKSFLNHLRSVGSAMRKAEEAIVAQRTFSAFFQMVFDEFVSRHLIEDFKRLHTQQNPFRFRVSILQLADEMEMDELLLQQLGRAYHLEGRASDPDHGMEEVGNQLRQIQRVFHDLDIYLEMIEDTSRRVEKRLSNTVRYMERISEVRTERLIEAFKGLAAAPAAMDDTIDLPAFRVTGGLPLGVENLFQAASKRAPVGPQLINRRDPDPAFLAFRRAMQEYQARTMVTPRRLVDYLEQALGERGEIEAKDLPVDTLDDFFVFERLRALEFIEGGVLAQRFTVSSQPGECDNGWITCKNFKIMRRKETADAAA